MYNNIIGNKYEQVKDLDIKEIAKLIRKDLKQFKDCKLNVSISAIRTVDKKGGFDLFLKNTKTKNLSLRVKKIKKSIATKVN